jgi:hypothetical protein
MMRGKPAPTGPVPLHAPGSVHSGSRNLVGDPAPGAKHG